MLTQTDEYDFRDSSIAVPQCNLPASRAISWSIIIPFHNESDYLPFCLESLASQIAPARLILVDNGSTDKGSAIAREVCDRLGLDACHVSEMRPGKVAALQRGLSEVTTSYLATCDADTVYPPDYLKSAERLLRDRRVVAAIAATTPVGSARWKSRIAGLRLELTAALLKQQCLNGGAGQVFRSSALRACGGFNPATWNWVLEDHEIIARIEHLGRIAYHRDFYCHPADRHREMNCTGWVFAEQLRYHLTSSEDRLKFFHEFLAPRLRARALSSEKLRRMIGMPAVA